MNCCPCGDVNNAVPQTEVNVERRHRFPRQAHNRPLYPSQSRDESVYRGFEDDLEIVYQFADDVIDFRGIQGVRTNRDLVMGNLAVRYQGERIDPDETERRIRRSEGGKIVDAGENVDGERVYIDGAIGGNIACMINHHCDAARVNVEMRKFDNNGEPEIHVMVIKPIMAGSDLFFENRGSVSRLAPDAVGVVRTFRCFCKGFDPITKYPICERLML